MDKINSKYIKERKVYEVESSVAFDRVIFEGYFKSDQTGTEMGHRAYLIPKSYGLVTVFQNTKFDDLIAEIDAYIDRAVEEKAQTTQSTI